MKGLFKDVIKMGGPNIPDGGLSFGIQNRALWDAKLWLKSEFCNKPAELEKIETYCRASQKKKIIEEFGGLEEYYLIGKIKDYVDLEDKVFSPIRKELKKKYGLKVRFRYLDIEGTLLKLIKLRNSISADKLKDNNFYEKIISAMNDNSIITDLVFEKTSVTKEADIDRIKPLRKEVANLRKN